jgi:hypothetical protein
MGRFFSEIFQDVDGGASAKRVAFLSFVILFIFLTTAVYFRVVPPEKLSFVQTALDKTQDLIKWLGGFILAEHAPQLAASARGGQTALTSPVESP